MTKEEQKAIERLNTTLQQIRQENEEFRRTTHETVQRLTAQVEKKHAPIYLEQDILSLVQEAIGKSISAALTGYNSPLTKVVEIVIGNHLSEIRATVEQCFQQVIRTEEFKKSIVEAFAHKVARSVVSGNEGLIDKVIKPLKEDPIFRAKLSIALDNVVNEYLQLNQQKEA